MSKTLKIGLIFAAMGVGGILGCVQADGDPEIKSNPVIVFSKQYNAIEAIEFTGIPVVGNFVRIRDKETSVVCYGPSTTHLSCTTDLTQDPSVEQTGWTTLSQDEIQLANNPDQIQK